jgi:predicted ribosomally synthesized peptide with nif11-like leader
MNDMEKMYQKVAEDSELQQKFSDIMSDAEKAGEAETKSKLIAFAGEAGFEISIEEMSQFFAEKIQNGAGELSETELDMVAGGKSSTGFACVMMTILTVGTYCAMRSAVTAALNAIDSEIPACQNMFK